jgi:hypothetical protein
MRSTESSHLAKYEGTVGTSTTDVYENDGNLSSMAFAKAPGMQLESLQQLQTN